MFYGSNLLRNDNPGWPISNATETGKVPNGGLRARQAPGASAWASSRLSLTGGIGHAARNACLIATAWLIGLPRRAGRKLHAVNDAEARWHGWQVTETLAGLGRQYRDLRWDALRYDPAIRRDAMRGNTAAG